jgi:hypothetical protein
MTMAKLLVVGSTLSILLGTSFALAQQLAQQPQAPHPMTFFVTSVGIGKGGDLGGVAGADAHCQRLAAASGAGNRTVGEKIWHAYTSTNSETPRLNESQTAQRYCWRLISCLLSEVTNTKKRGLTNGFRKPLSYPAKMAR